MSAIIIYSIIRIYLPRKYALLGALVFYSTGIVTWESSSGFVDLALTFYILGLLRLYIVLRKTFDYRHMIYISIFAGFAVFSKISGAPIVAAFGIIILYDIIFVNKFKSNDFIKLSLYPILITLIMLPWLVRNMCMIGNPFYPFCGEIFNTEILAYGIDSKSYLTNIQHYGIGKDIISFFLTPINLFVRGGKFDYGGLYGPVILSLLPFIFLSLKEKLHFRITLITVYGYLVWFVTSQQARLLLPPVSLAVISIIYGLKRFVVYNKILKASLKIILVIGFCFNLSVCAVYSMNYMPAGLGLVDKHEFLKDKTWSYDDIQWMNANLSDKSRVMTAVKGLYYLDIPRIKTKYVFNGILKDDDSPNAAQIMEALSMENITHIYYVNQIGGEKYQKMLAKIIPHLKLVYSPKPKDKYGKRTLSRKPFKMKSFVYEIDYY
jgi:hypothetical protein